MTDKKKGGRPKAVINYPALEKMCAIQCTGEECAAILGMDYDTLNNRLKSDGHGGFSEYFRQKSSNGKASLRRKQYQKAVEEGNPTMLIWLGKQWLGQVDRVEQDNISSDGSFKPTTINLVGVAPSGDSGD